MKTNEYLLKDYIINASDILYLLKTKSIKELLKRLTENKIEIHNKKIHTKPINHMENFIFLLDQYIYYIKKHIFIDPLEIRFLIELSIDNKLNEIFLCKKYFLDNQTFYIKEFKKLFVYNFKKNQKIIKKNVNNLNFINNFMEICSLINNNKHQYYTLFDKITKNNLHLKLKMWKDIKY